MQLPVIAFSSILNQTRRLLQALPLLSILSPLGAASYYVDYASGNDLNAGTSTSLAWQHCPGDPAAAGLAASTPLLAGDTVLFKGGVTYVLTGSTGIALNWSGTQASPITYDGNTAGTWGTGRAVFTDNNGSAGLTAFYAGSARSWLAFNSLEFAAIGGSASLPADGGTPVPARFGGGIAFASNAYNVTVSGCYFHELGYYYNQKPMSAASLSGTAISLHVADTVTISNCDFSHLTTGVDLNGSTSLANVAISTCSFHDSVVWPLNLVNGAAGLLVSGCTETNNTQFDRGSWAGYGDSPRTVTDTVAAGASVTFTASSTASPSATYQWQKNGTPLAGATNTTLSFGSVSSTDAGIYTVFATNSLGSSTSHEMVLNVTGTSSVSGTTSAVAPVITTQPVSQTVTAGANVSLMVAASGSPTPTYQWFKNGSAMSGATSTTLSLNTVSSSDAAIYTATATNSAGSATSTAATLTLTNSSLPVFTLQPVSQIAAPMSTTSFSAAASGSPSYIWYRNGVTFPGWTSATITLYGLTTNDEGTYVCVATNSLGSTTSNSATLTLSTTVTTTAPSITTQPTSQTVTAGLSASFTVSASGSPAPTYQWLKNGSAINGATNATYTIASTSSTDAATYTATATNSTGTATSNGATLTVNPVPVVPAITTQPASQTVTAGSSVSFSVAASGSPAPTYQWLKNGAAINGATNATYTIASTTSADAATYTATATNSAGSTTSNAATLTVNPAAVSPAITTQPASQTVTAGTPVSFTVAASGSPAPSYQWFKNGTSIAGATTTTFTIASTTSADAATYTATATNSAGSTTSNAATLTVNPAAVSPAITTQPASQTVTAGTPVSFTVAASGSPAPSYQWFKNGTSIAGATATTFTIASTTGSDAATYTVTATNSVGSATSNGAILTVNSAGTAPAFTLQPVSQTAALKSSVTFTATASGVPTPTYQWAKDGVIIAGATSSSLTLTNVNKSANGTYKAVATNSAGSATSSGATLTVTKTGAFAVSSETTATTDVPGGVVNLSVRANASTGDDALIVGFVVSGNATKSLLVRGAGPALADFGVAQPLADPVLSVYQGSSPMASNDDWGSAVNAADIANVSRSSGAFALRAQSADAALLLDAPTGAYTAQIVGKNGTSGTGLVELYDTNPGVDASLVNVSVRTAVKSDADLPAIGFVVSGTTWKTLLVRAVGPSLAPLGVNNALADPQIEIYQNGTRVIQNDDWAGNATLGDVFRRVGAFPLADGASKDAAVTFIAPPGAYTAVVSGVNGSNGTVLVEVYDVQ